MRWIALMACCLLHGIAATPAFSQEPAPATRPAPTASTQPADELIALNFPDQVPLKVLIDYTSQRLGTNIIYDEQIAAQRLTIKSPTRIPASALMDLLESVLRSKGLMIVPAEPAGWKRIVPSGAMAAVAQPTTRGAVGDENMVVAQIFQLQHMETQKIEPVIRPFLTQPGGSSIGLPEQRLLIVTDVVQNIKRVSGLVALLDQPREQVSVQFVPVQHLEASAVAQQVNQILAAKQKSSGPAGPADAVEIAHDPRTNRMILIGSRVRVQEAAALITELDVPLALVTRIYQFQVGSPARADRLVRELIGPLAAKTQYQSAVDTESRTLIVTASAEVHARIEQLKNDLDIPLKQEDSPIRFYKLTNTTASAVLETIRAIEGSQGISSVSLDAVKRTREEGSAPGATASPAMPPPPVAAGLTPPGPIPSPTSATPVAPAYREQPPGLAPIPSIRTAKATITADANTNTIIVVADPDQQQVYEQLIKMLDRRRPQVLVECTIVTLDTSDNFSLGVELSVAGGTDDNRVITLSSFGLSTVNAQTGRLALRPGLGFNGALISSDIADVVVRALATSSRARVVSAPKILVNDNATGTLASIAEAPFTSVNASDTVATTSFAGYATAGTTVSLTPHISSDGGHLQLEFAIALNNFSGEGANGIPPPRQSNTVQSNITIPDGHTIVVGGLNRHNMTNTKNSVPLLGQLPILEYLFSNRTRGESTQTLFVFIRPVVLRDDQFEDLKFLSDRELTAAGIPSALPESEPLLLP